MRRKSYRSKLYIGLALLSISCFIFSYLVFEGWITDSYQPEPVAKQLEENPTIKADTKIKKEIFFMCNDKVVTTIPTTSKFIGMDFKAFEKQFSPEEGWQIDDSVKNELVITRYDERICPYHREFRHLGIDEGCLAIFEGPLGYNQKVLQRENVLISSLPLEVQKSLNQAMDYNQQSADLQASLKNQYEFEEESQLSVILENFDEYRVE